MLRFGTLFLWIALFHCPPSRQDEDSLRNQAVDAAKSGDLVKAARLANQATKLEPSQSRNWLLRAEIYSAQSKFDLAASDYTQVAKLDPANRNAWQRSGEENFKAAKFARSVADFDEYLKLAPDQKPYHWQRGISLYYAGKFADGAKQFELHQTVNSQDVENAVWHFLCNTRAYGLEVARKKLIPINSDSRVPMAQVHQLFAGKATAMDVVDAAKNAPPQRAGEPIFYANLYLSIYYDAIGDSVRAREFIVKAADRAKENGYMGQVARIHADKLTAKSQLSKKK